MSTFQSVAQRTIKLRLARVFPRRTTATPDDAHAFIGSPPRCIQHVDTVDISCTFTADKDLAMQIAEEWDAKCKSVSVGGPAFGDRGGDFVPGKYLKRGYVITSRGCPNRCWFCDVPIREGREMRELPITDGWNLLDSNLLACSRPHIDGVFAMLKRQTERVQFTGGLEAARLEDWHVSKLWDLRPEQMYFAYDTPDDLDPLVEAGRKLRRADFTRRHLRCYVLIGHPKDTLDGAQARLLEAWDAGFMPMAMLWLPKTGAARDGEWKKLQRRWARPAITRKVARELVTAAWEADRTSATGKGGE